jgi:hypothetical protein
MKTSSTVFFGVTLLCAAPFLSPCTFGVGAVASKMISKAGEPLKLSKPLDHLPTDQLREWARRPGPKLSVVQTGSIRSNSLIQDAELVGARQATRKPRSLLSGAADATEFLAALIAITDAGTFAMMDTEPTFSTVDQELRKQLIISESPFILLQGRELPFSVATAGKPAVARARYSAKLSWIGPEGLCFALANRIHFRAGSDEIILEGMPGVASGGQYVRGQTLMSLNVRTRVLRVVGKAGITEL